eukprot:m.110923 g.110923  ORF g.110923 m.110923 type:complete len:622 (-) comp19208_c1_seq3:241-2106(-)
MNITFCRFVGPRKSTAALRTWARFFAVTASPISRTRSACPSQWQRTEQKQEQNRKETKNKAKNRKELKLNTKKKRFGVFQLHMNNNVSCALLCEGTDTVGMQYSKAQVQRLAKFIRAEYRAHWLLDNLPSATRIVVDGKQKYIEGFPLGYVGQRMEVNLFNHVVLVVKVHEYEENAWRIVGFEIKTASIESKAYKRVAPGKCSVDLDKHPQRMMIDPSNMKDTDTVEIVWSYGVRFEPSPVAWASRWDAYLEMSDSDIHWFSIVNSLITVVFLSGICAVIVVRTLRRDIARYNDDEDDDTLEPTGWKIVHGDVFRAPVQAEWLVTFVGTGVQLLGMLLVTLAFAVLGMLSPASRGALMTVGVFIFMFMGLIAGYYAARLYKTVNGQNWKMQAIRTAVFFPALVFGVGFVLNFFIWGRQSSGAVPFTTMLALLCMWFGISLPLTMGGFFFGFRKGAFSVPISVNQIPRQVPPQQWYLQPTVSILAAGVLPFGAVFIELFFIYSAIWENQFYYLFGFLFLVFLVLLVSCSEITIVMVYLQLCAEDYKWWWRSFLMSGGCAIYVFLYSVFYYVQKLHISDGVATLMFFGYSFLMSFAFFLLTGTIGFFAAFFFVRKIYGSIKIE